MVYYCDYGRVKYGSQDHGEGLSEGARGTTTAEILTFTVPNTSFPRLVPLTCQRVVVRPVVDVALVTRHSDHSLVGPVSRVNVAMIRGRQLRTLHSYIRCAKI